MKTPQDNPGDSKEKNKVSKKKKTNKKSVESIESKEFILTNPEDVELLKSIIESHSDQVEQKPHKLNLEKDLVNLDSIVSEYLSSFLILGYSLDGKRITIKHIGSDRDEDALIEQLRFLFLKVMGE